MILIDKIRESFPELADKVASEREPLISLDFTYEPTTITSSKIGGAGYLPLSVPYPTNDQGKPYSLLAQINFSEMPKLDKFPKTGILGFYINDFDGGAGGEDRVGYEVMYFDDLTQESYDEEKIISFFEPYSKEELCPVVQREMKIVGTLDENVSYDTMEELVELSGQPFYKFEDNKQPGKYEDECYIRSSIGGHQYSFFGDEGMDENLLAQFDSHDGLVWGDYGMGQFFIDEEDLKNLDFSNVILDWMCS